jgi:penicillin-binding protein 2
VYFYEVGQALGVDTIAWYATACGLGEMTGVDIEHESSGLIPTAAWKKRVKNESWQGGETLNIAIGQGYNLVTPLQALTLTAAVANGGDRYKPRIVKTIKSAEGEVLLQNEPVHLGRLPFSPENLELVKKGLREVVAGERGTARNYAYLPDIEISGKTGSAQVVGRKENTKEGEAGKGEDDDITQKDHAWFVAYAPSDHPTIAVVVFVEHGDHGSWVSPIAKELIQTYLGEAGKDGMVAVVDSGEGPHVH